MKHSGGRFGEMKEKQCVVLIMDHLHSTVFIPIDSHSIKSLSLKINVLQLFCCLQVAVRLNITLVLYFFIPQYYT